MDVLDHLRPSQRQQIVVAFEIARPVGEPLTAVVVFGQTDGLDHRAHRAVQEHDPLVEQSLKRGDSLSSIHCVVFRRSDRSGGSRRCAQAQRVANGDGQFRAVQGVEVKLFHTLANSNDWQARSRRWPQ